MLVSARRAQPFMSLSALMITVVGTASVSLFAHPETDAAREKMLEPGRVFYDWVDKDGRLRGGSVILSEAELGIGAVPGDDEKDEPGWFGGPNVVTLADNGPVTNRIDVVFVGDGYRDINLQSYATHVNAAMVDLFAIEPFARYSTFFNVHRVDVVSNETGVDNDPVEGIDRDTALDMRYFCNGIERLLCVNVGKAYNAAENAPGFDQILAIANSSKYGGAGYPGSFVGTFAGANGAATDIAIHEFGHSFGLLADEYTYGGDQPEYEGPEPSRPNLSTLDAAAMEAAGTKWASWLGSFTPGFDNPISTYEGGGYHQFDIYRPSNNSVMRNLGRPFNAVGAEAIVIELYRQLDVLDSATPEDVTLSANDTVFVTPLAPVGNPLTVEWAIDGVAIDAGGATALDLSTVDVPFGVSTLTATVRDDTTWVRNEFARAVYMTETREWSVVVTGIPGDTNGDGLVGFLDLTSLIASYGFCGVCPADFNGDGFVDFTDLGILLAAWS